MSKPDLFEYSVERHYTCQDLGGKILAALAADGKDLHNLRPSDLSPVDEFHVRGRKATMELATAASLGPDMHVLDIGSGIGGPARSIAAEFGCRVTGIDLTREYCHVAEMLSEKVGLSHLVTFRQGDALQMQLPDESFDVVWTQHTAMNIPDKAALYREIHRVLKPCGTLALYDVLAGPISPVYYPVPWSQDAKTSFMVTPDELRTLLEAAGFAISNWIDTTESARSWFRNMTSRAGEVAPRLLGLNLLMGDAFQQRTKNQLRNLEENRVVLFQVTAVK